MSCKKFTIINTGSTTVFISYRKCDDNVSQYQINLKPKQKRNIWVLNDDLSIVGYSTPSITSRIFPITPSNTRTPTPSITPTKNYITPTQTNSNTPSETPTNTPSETPEEIITDAILTTGGSYIIVGENNYLKFVD